MDRSWISHLAVRTIVGTRTAHLLANQKIGTPGSAFLSTTDRGLYAVDVPGSTRTCEYWTRQALARRFLSLALARCHHSYPPATQLRPFAHSCAEAHAFRERLQFEPHDLWCRPERGPRRFQNRNRLQR